MTVRPLLCLALATWVCLPSARANPGVAAAKAIEFAGDAVKAAKSARLARREVAELEALMKVFQESQKGKICVAPELVARGRVGARAVAAANQRDFVTRAKLQASIADLAEAIALRIAPEKQTDAALAVIGESTRVFGRSLDEVRIADLINGWDGTALEGLGETLGLARSYIEKDRALTPAQAIEKALVSAGLARKQANRGVACATGVMKRAE